MFRGVLSEWAGGDAGDEVVVVGLGDFGAVEFSGFESVEVTEVVDVDLAVDLGGVKLGTRLPEEFGLGALAFSEDDEFAAYSLLLCLL